MDNEEANEEIILQAHLDEDDEKNDEDDEKEMENGDEDEQNEDPPQPAEFASEDAPEENIEENENFAVMDDGAIAQMLEIMADAGLDPAFSSQLLASFNYDLEAAMNAAFDIGGPQLMEPVQPVVAEEPDQPLIDPVVAVVENVEENPEENNAEEEEPEEVVEAADDEKAEPIEMEDVPANPIIPNIFEDVEEDDTSESDSSSASGSLAMPSFFQDYEPDTQLELESLMLQNETAEVVIPEAMVNFGLTSDQVRELHAYIRKKAKKDEAETDPEAIIFSIQEKQAWINESQDLIQDFVLGYFQNHTELNPEDFSPDTCRDCLHFLFSTYMSMYRGRDLSKAQTSALINEVMDIFKRNNTVVNSQRRLIQVFPRLHRDFRNASGGSASQKVQELLFRAVQQGNVDRVKRILSKGGVDVNAARAVARRDEGGIFRRHRARSNEPAEERKGELLFTAIKISNGDTAWKITSLLIEAKADLSLCDHRKQSPLHHAVNARHPKMIQKLLEMGKCDPMCRDERGFTAEEESIRRNSQIDREEFHPIFVEYKLPKRENLKKELLSLLEENDVVAVCMKACQEIESDGSTKKLMKGDEPYTDRREFTQHFMWDNENEFLNVPTKYEVGEEVFCIRKCTLTEPAKVLAVADNGTYLIAWQNANFKDDLEHPIGDLSPGEKSNGYKILDKMKGLRSNLGINAYEAWSQMAEDAEFQPYKEILPILAQWQQKREERVVWKFIGGKICDMKADELERIVHEDHAPYNEERMKMLCLLKRGVGFDTRGVIKKAFSADLALWKAFRNPETVGTWQWSKVSKFCGDILFALKTFDHRSLRRLLDSVKIEDIRRDPYLQREGFCFFGQLLKSTDVNCELYQECLECLVESVSRWIEENPLLGMWYLPTQATSDLLKKKIEGGEWDTEKHILKTYEACEKLLMKKLSYLLVLSCKTNDMEIYKNIANRLTSKVFYDILKLNSDLLRMALFSEQNFEPLDLLSMFDSISEEELVLRYGKEIVEKMTDGDWQDLVTREEDGAGHWRFQIKEKRDLEAQKDPMLKTNGRAEALIDEKWVPGEVIFKRHKDKHYLFKADTSVLEHNWIPCDLVRPSKEKNKVKETFKWKRHRGQSNTGEVLESDRKIKIDSKWSTFSNEDAVLSKGAAVYEVKFLEGSKRNDCYPQIGWANEKFEKRDPGDNSGCGDCENSWAVDGHRVKRWHAKSESWGVRWKQNSVISLVVDMDKKEFHVGIDGTFFHPLGKIFDHLHWENGLYPCLSGKNMTLHVRMYAHDQKYPLKKIAPLYQSVAANIIMLIHQCFNWKEYAYDVNESHYLPSNEEIEVWRQYHEFDFLYDKLKKLKKQEPSVLLANCISRKLYKKASELFDLFDIEQLISHPYLKSTPLFAYDILNLATDEARFFVDKFFEHLTAKTLGLDTLKTLARATFKNPGKFSTKLFTLFLDTCASEVNEEFTHWFLNKLDGGIIAQHWDEVQREGDDTCLILSNLLRDAIKQLEKLTDEMTVIDRFTGKDKLAASVLDFIHKEFKKPRGGITKDVMKQKFKNLSDAEIDQRMDEIIAAGDAEKEEMLRIQSLLPSKMTASFNTGVFGTVPFKCFDPYTAEEKEEKAVSFADDLGDGAKAQRSYRPPTASFNTGVFGSVPLKAMEGVQRATASYNSGVFGSVPAAALEKYPEPEKKAEAKPAPTASYNTGIFGSIGRWCLDPESAQKREKLKKPEKIKIKKKKKKSKSSWAPRKYGRRARGRARYRSRPREPPKSPSAYMPSSFGGTTPLFAPFESSEEVVKSKRNLYSADFKAYYKEAFASDPEGVLKEIESLGYINERAKEGFNLIKMFFNVIQAIYGVVSNARESYNLYFTLPTEKDFDLAFESGFAPCSMKKIKKSLDYLWPREAAFRNYAQLLSSDFATMQELLKDIQLKELSNLISRPMLINDMLHAKLGQALSEDPGKVEIAYWPEMVSLLCKQLEGEISEEPSPYQWFNSDTRHDEYILSELGADYPKLEETFNECIKIINATKSSLAVDPFFEFLKSQDEVALYNLLRDVSFGDLMLLEEVREKQPIRMSIENFLNSNPGPPPARAQIFASFECGPAWYKGTQRDITDDDKVNVVFTHGDVASVYRHQIRSFIGTQPESGSKAIFMEGEEIEATIPNAYGETNGAWYEGKVLSVLDDTGEYEIELMLPKHLIKTEEELAAERAASFSWPAEINVTIGMQMLRFKRTIAEELEYPTYLCCEPEELARQKLTKKDKERSISGEWDFMGDTAVFKEDGVCTFVQFGSGVWSEMVFEAKAAKKSSQVWQFWEGNTWISYADELNEVLREAGGTGVHRYVASNGNEYDIDLDSQVQRNVLTGTERHIRVQNGGASSEPVPRRPMPQWFSNLPQEAHLVLRDAAAMAGPDMPPDAHMLFNMQYGLSPDQIQELMDWYFRKPEAKHLLDTWDDEPDNEVVGEDDFIIGEKYAVKHRTATHQKDSVDFSTTVKRWMQVPYCRTGTLVAINEADKYIVLRVDGKECAVPCNLVKRVDAPRKQEELVLKKIKVERRFVRAIDHRRIVPRDSNHNPMLCAVGKCALSDDSVKCGWCERGHITKVDPYFHFSPEDPSDVLCYSCYNYSMELLPFHLRDYANYRLYELPYRNFWNGSDLEQISCFFPWPLNHLRTLMEDNLYSMHHSPLDFEFESSDTKLGEEISEEFKRLKAQELCCRFVHHFQDCSEKALDILPQISVLQLSELGHKDVGRLMNDTLLNAFSQWKFSTNKAKGTSQPYVTLRISKPTEMNLRQVEVFRADGEPFILRVCRYASNIKDSVESAHPAETLTDGKPGRVVYCKPHINGMNFVEFEILHCNHPKEIGSFRINADGKQEGIKVEIMENGVFISEYTLKADTDIISTPVQLWWKAVDLQAFFDSVEGSEQGSKWSGKLIKKLSTLFEALNNKLKDEIQNCEAAEQLEDYSIDWLQTSITVKQEENQKLLSTIQCTLGTLSILNAVKDEQTLNKKAMERILNQNFDFSMKKPEGSWMNFLEAVFRYSDRDTLYLALYCSDDSLKTCNDLFKRLKITFEEARDFSVQPPMIQRVSSLIQEEKKRRNLLKDVKAKRAAATQHLILTQMAKNLDIRSLSILMKKNVEGFGLQSPDGPAESCIVALIQAYFFGKGLAPKPPEGYFKKLCEDMIERMISLEMWQELLHVADMLKKKSDLPVWIQSKMKLINAINTIWSKVHFLQRQAIHDFLSANTAHKISCANDVINLLNDLEHHDVVSENIRSILLLEPSDRIDALERIGVSNDKDDDDLCNICYQLPEDTKLGCTHWICSACFLRIQASPEPFCPFCRTPLEA